MASKRKIDRASKTLAEQRANEVRAEAPEELEPTGFRRRNFLKGVAAIAGATPLAVARPRVASAAVDASETTEAPATSPPVKDEESKMSQP